jgi:GTP pyrophosphokinase
VQWASGEAEALDVQLAISAYDRRGLVRDLTDVLAVEQLSIQDMTTTTDKDAGTAHITVSFGVRDLEQLARVLRHLSGVPNVIHARRVH